MNNGGIHIRVADIIYKIAKHRMLIMVMTLAGLMTGMVISGISYLRGEMSKEYLITSSFSVNTQTDSGLFTSGYNFPDYSDINMAQTLADPVGYVLKSDKTAQAVIDQLGLIGVTTKDLQDNLEFAPYNDTQIIEMTLYWRNAKEGINIVEQINQLAPSILQETLSIGNISVLNTPSARYLVGGRLNVILWGYMAAAGLCIGLGIVLLELVMNPTLLNDADLEHEFGLEVLSEIEDDPAFFHKKESMLAEDMSGSQINQKLSSVAHIIDNRMRTKDKPQILYVTSTTKGEGKTSLLANLAVQLSDLEKKVLLVDFDLKHPTLASQFIKHLDHDRTLNAVYTGTIDAQEAVIPLTGFLDLIPTSMDAGSLFLDQGLFSIIQDLGKDYDYVLIDTPPVGISADPMSLNSLATAALFVVRYDTATQQEIKDALDRIKKSGVDVVGCILNGVQVSKRNMKNPAKEKERMKEADEEINNRKEASRGYGSHTFYQQDAMDPAQEDSTASILAAFSAYDETESDEQASFGFAGMAWMAGSDEDSGHPDDAAREESSHTTESSDESD